MASELEIFIGTYEAYLLSYKINKSKDETFRMERYIAYRSHSSKINCIDTNGKYLATGGSDDKIIIVDLKLNKEIQMMNRHRASVTSLNFTSDGSHLLSGSEDGQLIATRVGSWMIDNSWNKPHSGRAVQKVRIHETGKIAFTLGKDETLRAWDMIKGRQVNTTNVRDLTVTRIVLDNIELCPNGAVFAMSGCKTVSIIGTLCGKFYDEFQVASIVSSMCWIDNDNLLIGMENGNLEWVNVNEAEHGHLANVHSKRIKDMHYLDGFLATICSTGQLTLWSVLVSEKELNLICTTNITCRPICVRLIRTTKNRYKGELDVEPVKEEFDFDDVKSPKPIQIGKVTMEIDDNENDQSLNGYEVISKTTPKKQKIVSIATPDRRDDITKGRKPMEKSVTGKKRTPNKKKPVVVRSQHSDDDFAVGETVETIDSHKIATQVNKKKKKFDESVTEALLVPSKKQSKPLTQLKTVKKSTNIPEQVSEFSASKKKPKNSSTNIIQKPNVTKAKAQKLTIPSSNIVGEQEKDDPNVSKKKRGKLSLPTPTIGKKSKNNQLQVTSSSENISQNNSNECIAANRSTNEELYTITPNSKKAEVEKVNLNNFAPIYQATRKQKKRRMS